MSRINSTVILIFIILLMGGTIYYFVNQNKKYQEEIANRKQNEAALKGELVESKNKIGEAVISKAIVESERDKLKEYNEDLATELDKTKKDVTYLNKLLLEYKGDTQISDNDELISYGENIYGIKWEFIRNYSEDNHRVIAGLTKFTINTQDFSITPLNTTLTRDYLHFAVVTGLSEKGGIISSFGSTSTPNLTIKDINGWKKSDHKNRKNNLSLSLYTGYGLTYSPKNSMFYHGPQIGGGLSLDFW